MSTEEWKATSNSSSTDHNNILITCLFEQINLDKCNKSNPQILAILVAILTVCTVVPNGLVVAAMSTTKQYRRSPSHVLLLVLAICDLLIGLVSMPAYVVHQWMISHCSHQYDETQCQLSKFVKFGGYSFSSLTILTIALITIELYLAIVRPFVYEHRYNKQYFLLYLLLTWTLFLASNFVMLYAFPAQWSSFKSFVVSWLCIVIFLMIIVFHSLLSIEVGKLSRSTTTNPSFNTTTTTNNNNNNRINKKTFRMTTTIIIAFSICYLPLSVGMLYKVFSNTTSMTSYNDVMPWCEVIALCNSALDPLIYCFRLRFIRHKIRRMVCPGRFQKVTDVKIQITVRNKRGGKGGGGE